MTFIKVVSKREGFWRAGLRHSKAPHIYLKDELKGKLEQLKNEGMLDVTEIDKDQLADEIKQGSIVTFETPETEDNGDQEPGGESEPGKQPEPEPLPAPQKAPAPEPKKKPNRKTKK